MRFDVDVAARVGEVDIACAFTSDAALTAIVGPSGAGKTSVLNIIAGLLRPMRGHVRVGERTLFDAAAGIDVLPQARRIGYVFQDVRLFPHRRVRANLLYGGGAGPLDWDETVAVLGIVHLLDRWPKTLSGGEARRVAIARALLSNPSLLLLDEPLSSLDRARREEIMVTIERLRDAVRLPMLLVTHDAAEAERLGGRIVAMA